MKNITLSVDEKSLNAARIYAAKNGTTVNAIVRDTIDKIAQAEDRTKLARKRIVNLAKNSKSGIGNVTWKREDLYAR